LGLAVHIDAGVAVLAGADQVFESPTVKDLVVGSVSHSRSVANTS
jgi:hypothetical protein